MIDGELPRRGLLLLVSAVCTLSLCTLSLNDASGGESAGRLPCRYSVRDVGFVALEEGGHRLRIAGEETARDDYWRACRELLREYPIDVLRTDTGDGLSFHREDGPVEVLSATLGTIASLPSALASLRSSPLRASLGRDLLEHLGVILLLESGDAVQDALAHRVVTEAAERLDANLDTLEKPVDRGAKITVIPPEQWEAEHWLLWPLGMEADPERPQVAILFGRGRRLGEVLSGQDLNPSELYRRLALLGQSCECDLSRHWLYGPSSLIEWNLALREQAVARLSFDPESPLVRAEVERILQRDGRASAASLDLFGGEVDDILLGYSEQLLEVDPPSPDGEPRIPRWPDPRPPQSSRTEPTRTEPSQTEPTQTEPTPTGPPRTDPRRAAEEPPGSELPASPDTPDTTSSLSSSILWVALGSAALVLSGCAALFLLRGARSR